MTRERRLAAECLAGDLDAEMTTTVTRAGVARMTMAVVAHDEMRRGEGLFEAFADDRDAIDHGSTLRNGRTLTSRYTPAAR